MESQFRVRLFSIIPLLLDIVFIILFYISSSILTALESCTVQRKAIREQTSQFMANFNHRFFS